MSNHHAHLSCPSSTFREDPRWQGTFSSGDRKLVRWIRYPRVVLTRQAHALNPRPF